MNGFIFCVLYVNMSLYVSVRNLAFLAAVACYRCKIESQRKFSRCRHLVSLYFRQLLQLKSHIFQISVTSVISGH